MGNCQINQKTIYVCRHPTAAVQVLPSYSFKYTFQNTLDDLFTEVETRLRLLITGVYQCNAEGRCDTNQPLMLDQLVSAVANNNDVSHPIWFTAEDDDIAFFLAVIRRYS